MANTSALRSSELFQVRDYVCVVTGGATGIGLMAAQALAANVRQKMPRPRVYIVGRRQHALKAAADSHSPENGQIIELESADVRSKEDLEQVIMEISSKEKHVNLLVTAAGIPGTKADPSSADAGEVKQELWTKESVEAWTEVYNADVTSVYFTVVAFLPLLQAASNKVERFHGSVITISSISGQIRHAQAHFNYNAAKGATVQLTKLMSAEFLKLGIRVNSISPGYFPSELTAKDSGPDNKSDLPSKYVKEKGHVPADRPGSDEEMAQAILFLAKNVYVNGQIISVDGGVTTVLAG